MPNNFCLTCNKSFYVKPCYFKLGQGKYCSHECYHVSLRGKPRPDRWTTRVLVKCQDCGKSFYTYPKKIANNRGKFCSKKCFNKSKITSVQVSCGYCNKTITRIQSDISKNKLSYCSKACYGLSRIGKKHPNSKRQYISGGYSWIYCPDHPRATKMGYISEHSLIYEKFLKRYLTSEEVIHHINRNKTDNRFENLSYFANNALHIKYHRKLQRLAKQSIILQKS